MITFVIILAYGSTLVFNEFHQYSSAAALAQMFMFGMVENSAKSFNYIVLGFEFEQKLIAIQVQQIIESFATFIFIVLIPVFDIPMT